MHFLDLIVGMYEEYWENNLIYLVGCHKHHIHKLLFSWNELGSKYIEGQWFHLLLIKFCGGTLDKSPFKLYKSSTLFWTVLQGVITGKVYASVTQYSNQTLQKRFLLGSNLTRIDGYRSQE